MRFYAEPSIDALKKYDPRTNKPDAVSIKQGDGQNNQSFGQSLRGEALSLRVSLGNPGNLGKCQSGSDPL